MANFLSITKEDNEQFSFILNSDTATEIINTRNDLLTIGNICHFKTSEGANLIKEQNILYSNVSLFNGVTPVSAPTSVRDLFDKLTALEFFDWIKDGSGSGVNRFDELADTFTYLGKAGQFVIVDDNEIQLTTRTFTPVERFTDLIDTPNALIPNKIPRVNNDGTLIEWADAVPFSAELPLYIEDAEIKIQKASASTDGYLSAEDFTLLSENRTVTLNTISELTAYTGSAKTVTVLENLRGGLFNLTASGLIADNGVIFNHATSGFWVRQLNGAVYPEYWGTGTTTSFSFIQSALNYASGKNIKVKTLPKQYNIDDVLIIKSDTELELDKKTIIRLNDNINKSMLRNFGAVYAGSSDIIDSNIEVHGGTWEGNGGNQTLYSSGGSPSLNVGIEFHNIENLRIHDLKINIARSYAVYISSAKNVFIDKVNVNNGDVKDLNRDGLHFNGPTDNVIINDCILRGTDDQLAFNADDIDYAYKINGGGHITNTIVNNILFDNTYKGIRLLTSGHNIENMIINNLTGSTSGNILESGNYGLAGTGGKVLDFQFSNIDITVNQTVNDGRVLFQFTKGGYGKITMTNIKVKGNHYVNPTFEFLNGVTMDFFKIKDFVSIATDTGAYSDFRIRQGEATFPNIGTFIIDGYNFISPVKASNLIDFNNLTNNYLEISNTNIASIPTIAVLANCTLNKIVLSNNNNASSANGVQLTNTSIQEMQIFGDYFKNASGFAFSQDTASDIVSLKGNAYINNNNVDVSTNSFITYQNNGVTKQLKAVSVSTLNDVLVNGNTSALTASIKGLDLSQGASDSVPSLIWGNTSYGWGMFERTTDGNLKLSRYVGGVLSDVAVFNRSTGSLKLDSLSGTGTRQVVADASGNLSATTAVPILPLKYVAILNQSLTSAPTAAVLENTITGTPVWSRTGVGDYKLTITGAFTSNKTFALMTPSSSFTVTCSVINTNEIQIRTFNSAGVGVDSGLSTTPIEIRVYP